jgi:DNA-binding LacI/PurR family transcriptional regulator
MDAVFVGNDQMALGVLQVVCQKGMEVPQDMAVVGFDGMAEAAYYSPPLTTIQQDQQKLGCIAVHELIHVIEANRQDKVFYHPKNISLDPELIIRASSRRI